MYTSVHKLPHMFRQADGLHWFAILWLIREFVGRSQTCELMDELVKV
jgi:hypothetical protein